MKRVSVIVPTFRDTDELLQMMDALKAQTWPSNLIEILIIDNTTEFELRTEGARLAPARLLHEARKGSYAARNAGLAHATGDILAFTDADCLPHPNWIERGVAALERHNGRALLAGRIDVFAADAARPGTIELFELAQAFPQKLYAEKYHFGATANVMTSRAVIDSVGGFYEASQSSGDNDFGKRVHAAGYPVIYAHDVVVRHPARRTFVELTAKTRRLVRGALDHERGGRLPRGTFRRGFLNDLRPPLASMVHVMRMAELGSPFRRMRAAAMLPVFRYYRAYCRIAAWLASGLPENAAHVEAPAGEGQRHSA